ncbi:MAG: gamma carbonic anhydrase family protein [Chloroflexi bacterium]|nr:gamma carbonic anhydrase family protein [Chloroflexota bacterium]
MIRDFNGKSPKIAPSAFVSEAAYIVGDVEIGENSSIWPGAVLRADFGKITVGNNTSIEDNCVVHGGTDVVIGNNTFIGHGAVVHCRMVGNNVLIGNNATVLDGAEVGDFCVIGAGSVVAPETKIPDRSLAMGVPARIKRQLSEKQLAWMENGLVSYTKLAQEYKQQGL